MTGDCPTPCAGCTLGCSNLAANQTARRRDDTPPRGIPRPIPKEKP